jgi:hypothetical protein
VPGFPGYGAAPLAREEEPNAARRRRRFGEDVPHCKASRPRTSSTTAAQKLPRSPCTSTIAGSNACSSRSSQSRQRPTFPSSACSINPIPSASLHSCTHSRPSQARSSSQSPSSFGTSDSAATPPQAVDCVALHNPRALLPPANAGIAREDLNFAFKVRFVVWSPLRAHGMPLFCGYLRAIEVFREPA